VWELLSRKDVRLSYLMSALVMMSGFILIPNIPAYVVHNLGFPLGDLWKLYLVGGVASFITLRLAGPRVDRYGAFRTGTVGALLGVVLIYVGFVDYPPWLPMYALFIGFMVSMGIRNVSYNTLTSRVPENPVRARFMSLQSAISHMASALASAVFAPMLLTALPDERLVGMERVAQVSILLALAVPPMLFIVERGVRAKATAGGTATLAPSSSSHR
jgi:predicted MFS family arabinose efflux permease